MSPLIFNVCSFVGNIFIAKEYMNKKFWNGWETLKNLSQFSEDIYAFLVVFVLPLNSAANPILYTFTTNKYRKKLLFRATKIPDRTSRTLSSSIQSLCKYLCLYKLYKYISESVCKFLVLNERTFFIIFYSIFLQSICGLHLKVAVIPVCLPSFKKKILDGLFTLFLLSSGIADVWLESSK